MSMYLLKSQNRFFVSCPAPKCIKEPIVHTLPMSSPLWDAEIFPMQRLISRGAERGGMGGGDRPPKNLAAYEAKLA